MARSGHVGVRERTKIARRCRDRWGAWRLLIRSGLDCGRMGQMGPMRPMERAMPFLRNGRLSEYRRPWQ
jgi:hypothetical protein